MSRQTAYKVNRNSIQISEYVLPVNKGGTSANLKVPAGDNLNLLTKGMMGGNNGTAVYPASGIIADENMPLMMTGKLDVTISGATSLTVNATSTYTITNYDSFTTYSVSALGGSVSRSGSQITYTAPATAGSGGFSVNGRLFAITVN